MQWLPLIGSWLVSRTNRRRSQHNAKDCLPQYPASVVHRMLPDLESRLPSVQHSLSYRCVGHGVVAQNVSVGWMRQAGSVAYCGGVLCKKSPPIHTLAIASSFINTSRELSAVLELINAVPFRVNCVPV